MKPAPFDYVNAKTLDEAVNALASSRETGRVIAGGQSLMAVLNMRLSRPELLVDISRLAELNRIERAGDFIEIGAAVTQAAVLDWSLLAKTLPLLAKALPHVGHIQTRNRGTICGSLCHADPSSEIPLVFATTGGEIVLRNTRGKRSVKAFDFQTGMLSTCRRPDEIAITARFPVAKPGAGFAFSEVNRRHGDFAIVAVAAYAQGETVRLGVGGVADIPKIREFTAFDRQSLDKDLNAFAWDCGGYDDIHATARYRRELVRTFGRKVIEEALECRA